VYRLFFFIYWTTTRTVVWVLLYIYIYIIYRVHYVCFVALWILWWIIIYTENFFFCVIIILKIALKRRNVKRAVGIDFTNTRCGTPRSFNRSSCTLIYYIIPVTYPINLSTLERSVAKSTQLCQLKIFSSALTLRQTIMCHSLRICFPHSDWR